MTPLPAGSRERGSTPLPPGVRRDRIEPLWDRISRERVRVGLFIAAFIVSVVISAAIAIGVTGIVVGLVLFRFTRTTLLFELLPQIVAVGMIAGAVAAVVHVSRMLTDPQRRLLRALGAKRSEVGTLLPTKGALHDMAVAGGYRYSPQLWTIEECDRVNAFCVAFGSGEPVVGVTRGFVDRLPVDQQRAVFANLIARLRRGDTVWATAVSAIMAPIWKLRDRQLRSDDDPEAYAAAARASADGSSDGVAAWLVIATLTVLLTELLMAGHESAARRAASRADAEGMLLLKDPRAMLAALENVLEVNNTVPTAGEAYSMLFYCWAGFGYAPEDDPEMVRIARLREVLGAEGLAPTRDEAWAAAAAAQIARQAPPVAPTIEREALEDGPAGRQ